MADAKVSEAEDSAEKAYAAASEAVTALGPSKEEDTGVGAEAARVELEATQVEFPAKAKRGRKPRLAGSAPVTPQAVAKATPRKQAAAKAKPTGKVKATKAKPTRKPVVSRPAPKPANLTASNTQDAPSISQLKDKIMATPKTPDFTKSIQDAIADAQEKAKVAFEKSTSSLGEITEFTKGNVEALVESGKILAAGAQELGSAYAADSRAAFETLSADVKELTSVKTPTDFVKLQGDLLRRNFDAAVAAGSKNSEAMLKLVNEAFAPISGRFNMAVEKAKQAA